MSLYRLGVTARMVFTHQQEIDATRGYVTAEINHWRALLSDVRIAGPILVHLEPHLRAAARAPSKRSRRTAGDPLDATVAPVKRFSVPRQLRPLLEITRNTGRRVNRERYDRLVHDFAVAIRLPDSDRSWLGAAVGIADAAWPSLPEQEGLAYRDAVRRTGEARQAAKNRIIEANLRLAWWKAKKFFQTQFLSENDVIQEANIGLMIAVDRFDPDKGWRFATYAAWWIRHRIGRAVDDADSFVRTPVHVADSARKLARTVAMMRARDGNNPTDEEIALETKIPVAKVAKLQEAFRTKGLPRSLDQAIPGDLGGEVSLLDLVPDEETPLADEVLLARRMKARVHQALEQLDPRDADILRRRFGIGVGSATLREVGEDYDLSRERIRQLEREALKRLHKILGPKPP